MSIHAAAELVAERIRRSEYVEIVAHYDADGIAAGSILAHAIARAGLRFRLRIRREIAAADLRNDSAYLLCDLGAGIGDLPRETMVVDHHEARFTGEYQVNPELAGIDGDKELSGAGTAYIVASKLGDNRDLAGLAMLGMIGDRQELSGANLEIFNDGVANGIITVKRGVRLAGRDLPEKLLTAITPVLDGISGDEAAALALAGVKGEDGNPDLRTILSSCVLAAIGSHNARCVGTLYGDTYGLEREVIGDAHSFATVIDACGKTGRGDLGAELCLRSSRDLAAAWDISRKHRLGVIGALHSVLQQDVPDGIYEVAEPVLSSDVADALSCRSTRQAPIAVFTRLGSSCHISARCPEGSTTDLGKVVRTISEDCGGYGGGHRCRAGATIPCDRLEAFRKGWQEAVAV